MLFFGEDTLTIRTLEIYSRRSVAWHRCHRRSDICRQELTTSDYIQGSGDKAKRLERFSAARPQPRYNVVVGNEFSAKDNMFSSVNGRSAIFNSIVADRFILSYLFFQSGLISDKYIDACKLHVI